MHVINAVTIYMLVYTGNTSPAVNVPNDDAGVLQGDEHNGTGSNEYMHGNDNTIKATNASEELLSNQLRMVVFSDTFGYDFSLVCSIRSAIRLAMRKIENDILPGKSIIHNVVESHCKPQRGVMDLLKSWESVSLPSRFLATGDIIIGEECSQVCEPVALVASASNIPYISTGCTSSSLSNKQTFTTFSRVVAPWLHLGQVFVLLLERMNWKRVVIITASTRAYVDTGEHLEREFTSANVVTFRHSIEYLLDEKIVRSERLEKVLTEESLSITSSWREPSGTFIDGYEETIDGIILATMKIPDGPMWDSFTEEVADELEHSCHYTRATRRRTWKHYIPFAAKDVQLTSGLYHDAALLWAISRNKTMGEQRLHPNSTPDGHDVAMNARNITFDGVTGNVNINENGDRITDYTILMIQYGKFVPIFDFIASKPTHLVPRLNTSQWTNMYWPGHIQRVPLDTPPCGWNNELCNFKNILSGVLVVLGLMSVFVIAAFGLRNIWRNMKLSMDLQLTNLRQIDWDDLEMQATSTTSKSRDGRSKQAIAKYKSTAVSVKMIQGRRHVNTNNTDIQMELKYMRDMQHRNVNSFVGTCSFAPNKCILMIFCKRGSLQDVLYDKFFNLSFRWRQSFALDVAQIINILQSPLSKWTLCQRIDQLAMSATETLSYLAFS